MTAFDKMMDTLLKDKNLSEDAVIKGTGSITDGVPSEDYTPDVTIRVSYLAPVSLSQFNKGSVTNDKPEAHCKSADVAAVVYGTKISIRGIEYNVAGIHPDGSGITVLLLSTD